MKEIVEDQYTAARAYFLCVIGLLFFESVIRFPSYFLEIRNRGRPFAKSSRTHFAFVTYFHKAFTLPSFIPFITNHNFPDLLRFAVFAGLNVLWGWNSIEYSTDYKLYGWLTIANGGLALLMAARSNLFAILTRIPSSVLLMYHRWIGLATVAHATTHFSLNIMHDIKTNQLSDALGNTRIRIGIMAWLSLCLIAVTSLSFIRRRWFEVFYYSHAVFFVFVVGALIHATKGPEFLLPGLSLWVIDRIVRFWYNFRPVQVLSAVSYAGDLVKLKVEGFKTTHPGQIVWIQIPGISFLNWHPFTVASAPGDKEVVLAVRGLGGYTKALGLLTADSTANLAKAASENNPAPSVQKIAIRVDGPYRVGSIRWGLHPVTVLVAGGIGITPSISIASHIVRRGGIAQTQGYNNDRWHVHLLWVIRDIRHVQWFEAELKDLAAAVSSPASRVTFAITISATHGIASTDKGPGAVEACGIETSFAYDGPGTVIHGRPDIMAWFADVKVARQGLDAAVNICGPRSLIDDARKAAAKASWKGAHFHVEEEVFEF